jgi:hypothetical protein
MTGTITHFRQMVEALDYEQIARACDSVGADDLPELVALYWTLTSWPQRAAVVHLARNIISARMRPIMVNILSARSGENDEAIAQAKIIALCHLSENLNLYAKYDSNRALIEPTARQYLTDFCT